MHRAIQVATLCLCLFIASSLSAQSVTPTLSFNGHANASVPYDSVMAINASGTPMVPFIIAMNVSPGPTIVPGGVSIPLAIDAGLFVSHQGQALSGSGIFSDSLIIPNQPLLEGMTLHAVCITVDPGFPSFLGVSNAASFTFTRGANAGMDTAGLVNDEIPLDGSGTAGASPLPTGHGASWSIVAGPAGHNASVAGADTFFPTLSADIPGVYDLEMQIHAPGTTGGPADVAQVSIYEINVTSHTHGEFNTSDPLSIAATLNGPSSTSFGVLGGTAAVGGSLNHAATAGAPFTSVPMQVVGSSGQKVGTGLTIVNNSGLPLTQDPVDGLSAYVGQTTLDVIETGLQTAFSSINLSGPLPAMPPIPVANVPGIFGTTLFSADITPLSFSYDPTVVVNLTATTSGLNVLLTLTNVSFVFDISGLVFNAPYTDTGTMSMTSVDISMDIVSTATNGVVTSTVNNETASFNGAVLTFANGGLVGSFAGLLFGAVVPAAEALVATTLSASIPPIIDGIFSTIPPSIDLSTMGVNATLNIPISGFDYYTTGLGIRLNAGAQANGPPAGSLVLPAYYTTGGAAPTYTGATPSTGTPYGAAFSISQDVANQALAVATEAGSLDLTFSDAFDMGGTPLLPVAGAYAMLFPGVGFEKFDPNAKVTISFRPTVAPVAEIGTASGDLFSMALSDFILDLRVEPHTGSTYSVSIVSMGVSGSAGLNATYDPILMNLDLFMGSVVMNGYVRHSLPGIDASPLIFALTNILGMVLPTLTTPIASIPMALPVIPGFTLPPMGLAGIEADGPNGDYLSIFLL